MMVDEEGRLGYARLRGSPLGLSGPAFPRTGDLIAAKLCSWDCAAAMERVMHERALDERGAALSIRPALEQDLGRTPPEGRARSRGEAREVRRSDWNARSARGDESGTARPPIAST